MAPWPSGSPYTAVATQQVEFWPIVVMMTPEQTAQCGIVLWFIRQSNSGR